MAARRRAEILDGDRAQTARDLLVARVPYVAPFLDTPIETVQLTVDSWRVTDIANGMLPGKDLAAASALWHASRNERRSRALQREKTRSYPRE